MLMAKHKNGLPPRQNKRLRILLAVNLVLAVIFLVLLVWIIVRSQYSDQGDDKTDNTQNTQQQQQSSEPPSLSTEVVVDGRDHVWDLAFLPSGEMLFTERKGTVSVLVDGSVHEVSAIEDVYSRGEGGLMGLAVDPDFNDNRFIYTCFNSTQDGLDVRIVRWRLSDNIDALEDRKDIVTGMPSNVSGRHSGCRMAFGPDNYLWVGTGDSATDGSIPQDPKSLGGKILRVDRDGEAATQLNQSGEFDPRIFSYGHRNTQGLAFIPEPVDGVFGLSTEHGPRVDDEVNLLKSGNFGWDPIAPEGDGYNESVPMTDTQKFPDAVPAVWSSGDPTQAPSGAAFMYGTKWKAWNGALAVAFLKDRRLKFFFFDDNWQLKDEQERFVGEFGRLRAAVQGPDENLYVSTDNGEDDKIIMVVPD